MLENPTITVVFQRGHLGPTILNRIENNHVVQVTVHRFVLSDDLYHIDEYHNYFQRD